MLGGKSDADRQHTVAEVGDGETVEAFNSLSWRPGEKPWSSSRERSVFSRLRHYNVNNACMPLYTSHTGTCRDIKNPCEVRSTRLRLSTVSWTSQLSLTVSTTTTNHLSLPCAAQAFSPLAAVCPGPLLLALWTSRTFLCAFQFRKGPVHPI